LVERPPEKKRKASVENDANVRAAEAKLRRRYSTQVKIVQDASGNGGTIQIAYYTTDDLERVFDLLMCRALAASL
jgi:hypothetical protein